MAITQFLNALRTLCSDQSGQDMIEYALLAGS